MKNLLALLAAFCLCVSVLNAQVVLDRTTPEYHSNPELARKILRLVTQRVGDLSLEHYSVHIRFMNIDSVFAPTDVRAATRVAHEYKRALMRFDIEDVAKLSELDLDILILHELFHLYETPLGAIAYNLAAYDSLLLDIVRERREGLATSLARMRIFREKK